MPTGVWRRRRPLPVPSGMVVVQPIGVCTPAEAERYRAGRGAAAQDGQDGQENPLLGLPRRSVGITPGAVTDGAAHGIPGADRSRAVGDR